MRVVQRIRSAILGYKISRGLAPRGRTEGWIKPNATLTARHLRENPETGEYEEIDKRVAHGCITTVFVNDIVDSLVAAAYLNDYKYHDSGTGVVAESEGDTGLGTPTGVARATGTQLEGGSANIYRSVGTITYDASYAVTEHGLFDAATVGILMDRTVFSAINVVLNDKIEFTYEATFPAAG